MSLSRPCLGPRPGAPCPYGVLTLRTRCLSCDRQWQSTRRPPTAARGYDNRWRAYSRGRVAEVGYCQATPCRWPESAGTDANPLTTDHATLGLVLCRNDNSAKQHADRRKVGSNL